MFVYNLKKKSPSILQLKQSTKKKLTTLNKFPLTLSFSCLEHFTADISTCASWPCGGVAAVFSVSSVREVMSPETQP